MRIESNGFFAKYYLSLHDLELLMCDERMKDYPVTVIINGEYYTLEKEAKHEFSEG